MEHEQPPFVLTAWCAPPYKGTPCVHNSSMAHACDPTGVSAALQAGAGGPADYKRVSGHAFSAANPRGQRSKDDKRQFVRG